MTRGRRLRRPPIATAAAVLAALATLLPRGLWACAVCYGAPDSPITQGVNNGILVLLGFVGLVYIGVGKLFWDIRKRSKRLTAHNRRFQIIEGGKG
jgi:hypothetical protein